MRVGWPSSGESRKLRVTVMGVGRGGEGVYEGKE